MYCKFECVICGEMVHLDPTKQNKPVCGCGSESLTYRGLVRPLDLRGIADVPYGGRGALVMVMTAPKRRIPLGKVGLS